MHLTSERARILDTASLAPPRDHRGVGVLVRVDATAFPHLAHDLRSRLNAAALRTPPVLSPLQRRQSRTRTRTPARRRPARLPLLAHGPCTHRSCAAHAVSCAAPRARHRLIPRVAHAPAPRPWLARAAPACPSSLTPALAPAPPARAPGRQPLTPARRRPRRRATSSRDARVCAARAPARASTAHLTPCATPAWLTRVASRAEPPYLLRPPRAAPERPFRPPPEPQPAPPAPAPALLRRARTACSRRSRPPRQRPLARAEPPRAVPAHLRAAAPAPAEPPVLRKGSRGRG
jgi:hypothetical protein